MKYKPSYNLAKYCVSTLAKSFCHFDLTNNWDAVIPVPPNPVNLKNRLFDVSYMLASSISRKLNTKLISTVVKHTSNKQIQAKLEGPTRIKNANKSFILNAKTNLTNYKLLLIDDVVTSGSSVGVITSMLKNVGAESVDVVCLAKSRHFTSYRYFLREKSS